MIKCVQNACHIFEFEGERLTVPDTRILREPEIYDAINRMAVLHEEELFTHTLPKDIWDTLKKAFA